MKKVSKQEIVNTLLTDGQIVLDNYDTSQIHRHTGGLEKKAIAMR